MNTVLSSQNHLKRIFLIPIGLPGLGKTTLAKCLESTFSNQFISSQANVNKNSSENISTLNSRVHYTRVDYDKMLQDYQQSYQLKHPETPFHQIIDIVRGQADKKYLQTIQGISNQQTNKHGQQLIYLDRNNTPDIWRDITSSIKHEKGDEVSNNSQDLKLNSKDQTVLLMPNQPDMSNFTKQYNNPNPITPLLLYQCIKRIFSRANHSCLSSQDKPKVIEVLLKFMKLYDNVCFDKSMINNQQLEQKHEATKTSKYNLDQFDSTFNLDFLDYSLCDNNAINVEQNQFGLELDTIKVLIDGYNQTPEDFKPPSDETIAFVLKYVEKQIHIDNVKQQAKNKQGEAAAPLGYFSDVQSMLDKIYRQISEQAQDKDQSIVNVQQSCDIGSQIKTDGKL
eukprot:403356308